MAIRLPPRRAVGPADCRAPLAAASAAWRPRRRPWRPARPRSSPVGLEAPVRRTRTKVPCGRDVVGRAPRRAGRRPGRRRSPGSDAPTKRWLTCTHGARSQSARHSVSSRVNIPSAVVPPAPTPSDALDVLEQLVGAAQHAGDVGAHRHHVGPDRLGVQHVVERGRAEHLGRRSPPPARRSRPWPRGATSRPAPGPGGRGG